MLDEEINKERFIVHSGELNILDDDGNVLPSNEIKAYLERKKEEYDNFVIEKPVFLEQGTIVKLKKSETLYVIVSLLNVENHKLYDYEGKQIETEQTLSEESKVFNNEDIEAIYDLTDSNFKSYEQIK